MILIESKQNAALRHLARLGREKKYRRETGEMLCEGEKMLREALASGAKIGTVIVRTGEEKADFAALLGKAEASGAKLYGAPETLFRQASDVETPQRVLFSCAQPKWEAEALAGQKHVLLLDGVQDPGNLGTILRSADAFALGGVVLCEGCADPFSPKVVRATMGAIFRLPCPRLPLMDAVSFLRQNGLAVYTAALREDAVPVCDARLENAAVIVGSEGAGVTQAALAAADRSVIIPMAGCAESLNAGVAASILIYEMTKQVRN